MVVGGGGGEIFTPSPPRQQHKALNVTISTDNLLSSQTKRAQAVKIKPVPSVMSINDQHKNLKLQFIIPPAMLCHTYKYTQMCITHTHTRFLLKFAVCVNQNNPDNVLPRSLTNSHKKRKPPYLLLANTV